jgi:hypothetical protein
MVVSPSAQRTQAQGQRPFKAGPASPLAQAQTRVRTSPLAALLILLSLVLGAGGAAATAGDGLDPAARAGRDRDGAAVALFRAPDRNRLPDEGPGPDTAPFAPPRPPRIVTGLLGARPAATPEAAAPLPRPAPRTVAYRARAPPPP